MLSRNEMEAVIRNGGSVLHGGRLLSKIEHLPTDADLALASGDTRQAGSVASALQAQMAALQGQIDQLAAAQGHTGDQHPQTGDHPFVALVGQQITEKLIAAGYDTPEAITATSDEELQAIDGVGPKTVKTLRESYPRGA